MTQAGPEPARIPGAGTQIPPWESQGRRAEVVTKNLQSSFIRPISPTREFLFVSMQNNHFEGFKTCLVFFGINVSALDVK